MNPTARSLLVGLLCAGLLAGCVDHIKRNGLFSDLTSLEHYLSKGGDPNAISQKDQKSGSNRTLLHNAAVYQDSKMVSVLIRAGANPNAVDGIGSTPLMCLFTTRDKVKGRKEILEVLRPVTDLSILDVYGESALQLARKYGTEAEIAILEQGHAKILDREIRK